MQKSSMRLVKLNKTHSLYHQGYTHAFRFNSYGKEAQDVSAVFQRVVGPQYGKINWCTTRQQSRWTTKFGHAPSGATRPYWIGCYAEDAMMVQIAL